MAYYRDVAHGGGEVVIPREQPDDPEFDALAEELGATWLLSAYGLGFDEVRQGPPGQDGAAAAGRGRVGGRHAGGPEP